MTRKFDPTLGQYRDSGKFDGNDNQPAAGGMNALGGSQPSATKVSDEQLAETERLTGQYLDASAQAMKAHTGATARLTADLVQHRWPDATHLEVEVNYDFPNAGWLPVSVHGPDGVVEDDMWEVDPEGELTSCLSSFSGRKDTYGSFIKDFDPKTDRAVLDLNAAREWGAQRSAPRPTPRKEDNPYAKVDGRTTSVPNEAPITKDNVETLIEDFDLNGGSHEVNLEADYVAVEAPHNSTLSITPSEFENVGELKKHLAQKMRDFDADEEFVELWSTEFGEHNGFSPSDFIGSLQEDELFFKQIAKEMKKTL